MWAQELRKAVEALASSPETQIALLQDMGGHVDELGLQFDDAFRGWLPEGSSAASVEDRALIELIDRRLNQMSGEENSALWTLEALRDDQRWEELRHLARRALLTRALQ